MATLKEMFELNTEQIVEATELLKELSDREGAYVWKQLTAEGGDFVAYVTADDSASYPDGGTQDGYWYELVNIVEYTSGTTDLEDGTSELATNTFYFVTE